MPLNGDVEDKFAVNGEGSEVSLVALNPRVPVFNDAGCAFEIANGADAAFAVPNIERFEFVAPNGIDAGVVDAKPACTEIFGFAVMLNDALAAGAFI